MFSFNGCTTHNAAMTFHQDAPVSGDSATLGYFNAIVVYDSWSEHTARIAGYELLPD
ncbi:MAG: hypothetical protein R2860_15190 [Desulfobacterales bacterium]